MGLFDTVYSKYPLPMPEDPKGYSGSKDFQTKDLGSSMSEYTIEEDGRLLYRKSHYVREEGNPKAKSILDRIGHMREESFEMIHEKITDLIRIYDYQQTKGDYDYFIEYTILFKDGVVDEVKLFKFEAEENGDRKKREEEFQKEMEEHFAFTKTLKYKLFYKPYNKTLNFFFRRLNRIASWFMEFLFRLERKITL